MKKYLVTILLFFILIFALNAQDNDFIPLSEGELEVKNDSAKIVADPLDSLKTYAWKISPRLGERTLVLLDTLPFNFHQSSLIDGKGVAMGYLGNIGSPAQSKIFFERKETSRYNLLDAFYLYRTDPEDQVFFNTKVPYSNIFYQTGGSGERNEANFKAELATNFGKKVNVGFNFDYLYARGFYSYLYDKQLNYDIFGSYIGDRYKMHVFLANNSFTNSENGGITDPSYITDSDDKQKTSDFNGESLSIPVNVSMGGLFNKLKGRHLYMTNRYDLGNDSYTVSVDDSTMVTRKKRNYIPPASIILTTHYTDQRRTIRAKNDSADYIFADYLYIDGKPKDSLSYKYESPINDLMSYYSIKNTLALAMNEGFRSWTKFGLTAFVEYDMRKYSLPTNQFDFARNNTRHSENVLTIGGVLSKEQGKYLKYRLSAEKNLLDTDFKIQGDLTTKFRLFNRDIAVSANAYIKGLQPSFFENHFSSKYRIWNNDFSDVRRIFAGGSIYIPSTKTKLSGGFENIQNYIYYDSLRVVRQHSGSVQVVSLRLDQQLQAGIFHWDNQIVFQKSSNEEVLPLPKFSFYSNVYIATNIAKVLALQLGVDAHYHSRYYAPGYDPLTIQFYNQRKQKIGDFPIMTAYINLNLKYTRFFIMMYNLADGMGDSNYFSLPGYPVNPRVLKMGLSWRFYN